MKTHAPEIRIKLQERYIPILRNRGLNSSVLYQRPFDFEATSFTSAIEGLKPKVFNRKKQREMLESFLKSPFAAKNYCLVSAPDDGKAKLLAAYMMQHALARHDSRVALPLWVDLTGGFDNPLVVNRVKPSLLVINNVGSTSTQPKLEKLRDILEVYSDIPRIVVATGTDPYMFFMRYLFLPLHSLCYLTNTSIKKTVNI